MKPRKVYLDNTPLEEAKEKLFMQFKEKGIYWGEKEKIPAVKAVGRITAEAVWGKVSVPHYPAAAMDGIMVKAEETYGASETCSVSLKLGEQARFVDTGDPIAAGFDAVIMIEDIQQSGDSVIINAAASPWQHVRSVGEDIVMGEMVLPQNHKIRPIDLGAVLASGNIEVAVWKKPKVFVIPTGTELVEAGTENLQSGDIVDSNSWVLGWLAQERGAEFIRCGIIADNYEEIKAAVLKGVEEADIVVINAGSSAGSEDFTSSIVEELGTLIVHGVNTKPGKPVILGKIKEKPVIGVPGYPVSAVLAFNLFVSPLIDRFLGLLEDSALKTDAYMGRKITSPLGKEEFIQVKLGLVGENLVANPVSRGAGVTMSLVRSDGILHVSAKSEGLQPGKKAPIILNRPLQEINKTLVATGSHDLLLDILANELKKRGVNKSLSSSHVGSMAGLMALKKGTAHLAGIHLLDESTGEYNIPYLKLLGLENEVVLINLVYRQQGLILPKNNPKNIKSLTDLTRSDVVFINRQKGAGTRILLDYNLKQLGIDKKAINGYEREEYTHMAVAVAVKSGTADAGLAIYSAANALDLDFIPLTEERYDLAVLKEYYNSELFAELKEILHDESFCRQVEALGGYRTDDMGRVLYEAKE